MFSDEDRMQLEWNPQTPEAVSTNILSGWRHSEELTNNTNTESLKLIFDCYLDIVDLYPLWLYNLHSESGWEKEHKFVMSSNRKIIYTTERV